MMTFGSRIGAEYARYIQGTVVPMGSFRNNLVPKRTSKKAGTIAFISQYRYTQGFFMGSNFYSFWEFFEQADRLVLPLLEKYAKEKDKTLIIVPCSSHHKDDTLLKEKEYYNRLLGQTCAFSDWGWHGSSYETADSAEVVVAIDSSMGLESAARGTKAAIFSIRSQLLGLLDPPFLSYGWPGNYPDEGPFWTNQPEPAIFERILDHLFAISDEQWKAELDKHHFSDLMAYDPGNTILQSVLRHELGAPPQMDQKQ
jgi:surface carbohydrate biosynthesis protein